MAHQLQPFVFQGKSLAVTQDEDGEPLFEANALCDLLEYANSRDAVARHCKAEDVVKRDVTCPDAVGRARKTQRKTFIRERSMWKLLMKSEAPNAEPVQDWIAGDVLPSIRKTGGYTTPGASHGRQLPQNSAVRDLLLVGKEVARVPGVNPSTAMAFTLDAIEQSTGLPTRTMARALPSVAANDIANLNATKVGEPIGLKARAVNLLLERLGFHARDENGDWKLTDAGTQYGDTKPFHNRGHNGYEVLWKPAVIDVLREHISASGRAA